jgi:hypothetical protein
MNKQTEEALIQMVEKLNCIQMELSRIAKATEKGVVVVLSTKCPVLDVSVSGSVTVDNDS